MLTPISIASTVVWAVIVAIAIYDAFEVHDSESFDALVALVSSAIWMPTIIGVGAHTAWPTVALILLVLILLFEVFAVSVFVIAEEHMVDVMEREDVIHVADRSRRPPRGPLSSCASCRPSLPP